MSPRLLPVLTALIAAPVANAAEPTWVFFVDKGRPGRLDLERRARELGRTAIERRRRTRGDLGVDRRDLLPDAAYIAQVAARSERLRVTSRWLNAVSVEATRSQLALIAALPFVRGVRPVERRAPVGEPRPGPLWQVNPTTYGQAFDQLDLIGVPDLHDCGLTGSGVTIGVLDTGFSVTHQAFARLDVAGQYDFVNHDDVVEDDSNDPAGQHDHGTRVLSLIAGWDDGAFSGVAPDARVLLAKIDDLTIDAPIEDDWWVAGIEWLEANGADVVTGSIGFCYGCDPETFDGKTHPTSIAAGAAIANGVIVLNSAGNFGPARGSIIAPADTDGLIAVGSVGLDRTLAPDSSRGPTYDGRLKPDVLGPGVSVWTVTPNTADQYDRTSGTSFSTPLVAGVVALLKQAYPALGPFEMRELLRSTASRADAPDNDLGWGLVSGTEAAALFCRCHDHDGDGYYDETCGGKDCDDDDATVMPNAAGVCTLPEAGDAEAAVDLEGGCGCSGAGTAPVWLLLVVVLPWRRRAPTTATQRCQTDRPSSRRTTWSGGRTRRVILGGCLHRSTCERFGV